jgi:hypothetical protein
MDPTINSTIPAPFTPANLPFVAAFVLADAPVPALLLADADEGRVLLEVAEAVDEADIAVGVKTPPEGCAARHDAAAAEASCGVLGPV